MRHSSSISSFIQKKLDEVTLTAGGGEAEFGWFQILPQYSAHTLWSRITGTGYVTAIVFTAPVPNNAHRLQQVILYNNTTSPGIDKNYLRRDPIEFDAAYWCNIVFVNNHPDQDSVIQAWFDQTGEGA